MVKHSEWGRDIAVHCGLNVLEVVFSVSTGSGYSTKKQCNDVFMINNTVY